MSASADERILSRLARVGLLAPDDSHAAHVRERCIDELDRQRKRAARDRRAAHSREARTSSVGSAHWLEALVVGVVSLSYLAVVVREALAAYGGL